MACVCMVVYGIAWCWVVCVVLYDMIVYDGVVCVYMVWCCIHLYCGVLCCIVL